MLPVVLRARAKQDSRLNYQQKTVVNQDSKTIFQKARPNDNFKRFLNINSEGSF